jgi:hypothetical protein
MRIPPGYFRTGAVLSMASAVTTLALIYLPAWIAAADSAEARIALVNDPAYRLRAWTYLVHPFLVLGAALAVATRLRHSRAAWVLPGLLGFVLWGFTEAAQQAMTLFVYDPLRLEYLAGQEPVRSSMPLIRVLYARAWDAFYVLLLIGFLFGNVMYAIALRDADALGRLLAALYGAAALLTASLLMREVGLPSMPPAVTETAYPLLQPAGRVLIGVWLWRRAMEPGSVAVSDARPSGPDTHEVGGASA